MSAIPLPSPPELPPPLLAGRYQLLELLNHRCGVERYLAFDVSVSPPIAVQLVREPLPADGGPRLPADGSVWPTLGWEERLRSRCRHLGLPRMRDTFQHAGYAYLSLEVPDGVGLWDAWDDPTHPAADKWGWLIQLADLLQVLHAAGAIVESLRPEQVVLTPNGQVVLTDAGNLLPLPVPADIPILGGFSTAPELLTGEWIDARSDLFSFGALVMALLLGRELTDLDFVAPGVPKPYLQRFPDAHPLLGRLVGKTFTPDPERRFPTLDSRADDPSGFHQLIACLEQCQQTMGRVRLEVGAWTTTGMIRPGNEDAVSIVYGSVGGQDDLEDRALVVVADGMGGNEAGEVAAALAVESLTNALNSKPLFDHTASGGMALTEVKDLMAAAIKEANRAVYLASRQGIGRRGMGCTAEVVVTDGRRLVIGHVGDSRTYRFHQGELSLLTRDQTYINQRLEAGDITPDQAAMHPRRAELLQAIGGWTDIEPDIVVCHIEPGDWVLVCSDGLSNYVDPEEMARVFNRAPSAESAARQLVNLANLVGAPDNATAVVLRAV